MRHNCDRARGRAIRRLHMNNNGCIAQACGHSNTALWCSACAAASTESKNASRKVSRFAHSAHAARRTWRHVAEDTDLIARVIKQTTREQAGKENKKVRERGGAAYLVVGEYGDFVGAAAAGRAQARHGSAIQAVHIERPGHSSSIKKVAAATGGSRQRPCRCRGCACAVGPTHRG